MKKETIVQRTTENKQYSIEEIHKLFEEWDKLGEFNYRKKNKINVWFDGYLVKTYSQRYDLFRMSTKCVQCGLEANCYVLEKMPESKAWHFNLYYIDKDREILFTKDHIVPKSLGGKNILSNYQTMCVICNNKKGNNV